MFLIALWNGSESNLRELKRVIITFIWSSQSRLNRHQVSKATLYLPKSRGGIGLISNLQQMRALTSKAIIWTMEPGEQKLKQILRAKIRELSFKRWGLLDYSSAFSQCNTLPSDESEVWLNMCKSWNVIKKATVPMSPANTQERDRIPIWNPHVGDIRRTGLGGCSPTQQRLIEVGMTSYRHIIDVVDDILVWDGRSIIESSSTSQ